MLNHIAIMGRLVRDPELRRTGNGNAVCSFTVAVDRDFSSDGKREADFIDCVAWRQTGEFVAKYFTKGKLIAAAGRLQTRTYEDKSGGKRKATELVAEHCYFAESKRDSDGQAGGGNPPQSQYQSPEPGNDFALLEDSNEQLPF